MSGKRSSRVEPTGAGRLLERWARRISGDSQSPDLRLRATAWLLVAALAGSLSAAWGSIHLYHATYDLAATFFLTVVAIALLAFKLWRDRKLSWASHFLIGGCLAFTCFSTYFTGGLRLTNVTPFFMFIAVPLFLLGKSGLIWSVAAVAAAVGFETASWLGVRFPDTVPPETRHIDATITWMGSAAIVFVFVTAYERARESILRQLESSQAARNDFVASICHDIRAPLHAIMGMNRMLARSRLTEEQRDQISTSQRNAELIRQLLDDLWDLPTLEHSKLRLEPTDFDPVELLNSVERSIRQQADEKSIEVETIVDEDVPRWVRGDRARVRQILLNLGANGVKYTREGRVTLEARSGDGSTTVVFEVRDTGVGIAHHHIDRIFDKFWQAGGESGDQDEGVRPRSGGGRDESPRGAGLGLYVTRELTELMGGKLDVRSSPGKGSSFTIRLPFDTPASPGPASAPKGPEPVVALKVLLVDDDPTNRMVTRAMLVETGSRVTLAANGKEAVERWQEVEPDIVLMDIDMPVMDGLESIETIRREEKAAGSAPVSIVAVTGQVSQPERARCLAAGADICLPKPYTVDELLAAVRALS
jgi:signal transduction histidine kinase